MNSSRFTSRVMVGTRERVLIGCVDWAMAARMVDQANGSLVGISSKRRSALGRERDLQ